MSKQRFISRVILIKKNVLSWTKSTKHNHWNTFIDIEMFSKPDDTASLHSYITCYNVFLGKKENQ